MKNPKVSVIIPAYNSEKTLKKCLNSVLNQTYNNYEIIIVNNNSTDKTKGIIKKFQEKSKKIIYIFEEERKRGAARNTGEKIAEGKIILMTDSDCIVPEDWISGMTEPIINKNYSAVQGFQEPVVKNFWSEQFQARFLEKYKNLSELHSKNIIGKIDTKNFAIKKDVLEQIGFTSKKYFSGNDTDISIKLSKINAKVKILRNIIVRHHHPVSLKPFIRKQVYRGEWNFKIINDNLDYLKNTDFVEESSQTLKSFFKFYPDRIKKRILKNPGYNYYDIIGGLFWRVGITISWTKKEFNKLKNIIKKISKKLIKKTEKEYLPQTENENAEVILLIYQRIHNLKKILKAFSLQTYKKFKINILNNNKDFNKKVDKIVKKFSKKLSINLIHANTNLGSEAKFQIVKKTTGNPLIFIDDDMIPEKDFIEYMIRVYKKYGKKYILGWHAFQFLDESYLFNKKELKLGEEADFIGSGSLVLDNSVIKNLKEIYSIPKYARKMEDLWLSYIAEKHGYKLIKINKKVKHIPDKYDQFNKIKYEKEKLFKILREKGWRLLKDKKDDIKFNILITTYNFEDWIGKCIDSIKQQTYSNFECIIIDDHSEDNTYDIAKKLIKGDSRFRIFRNKKNCGAAYSRFRGFKLFKARDQDICMYVDGDDYLINPNVLERIKKEYQDDNCWFTYGNAIGPFCEQIQPIPKEVKANKDFRKTKWVYGHPRTYRYFLIKKVKIEEFQGPDGKFLPTCTDIAFLYPILEMSGKERIRYIPDLLYYYREHPKSSWKIIKNKNFYREYIKSKKPYQKL